ncbi:MAG: hypothetical protein HY073_05475 [Deltaproteobacteria bacterium]|nr:hypothetical protein [Deltaproteobacteria bacterium]
MRGRYDYLQRIADDVPLTAKKIRYIDRALRRCQKIPKLTDFYKEIRNCDDPNLRYLSIELACSDPRAACVESILPTLQTESDAKTREAMLLALKKLLFPFPLRKEDEVETIKRLLENSIDRWNRTEKAW